MENLFYSQYKIDEQYDLKGSKVDRHVSVDQISSEIARKDLDFSRSLKLSIENKRILLEQLECDTKVFPFLLFILSSPFVAFSYLCNFGWIYSFLKAKESAITVSLLDFILSLKPQRHQLLGLMERILPHLSKIMEVSFPLMSKKFIFLESLIF